MTLEEFIIRWQGKYIDFDGQFSSQCMDLMHTFVVEVLGLSDPRILAAPAAKDVYNNFDSLVGHDEFDKIANTPDGIPQEGDIVLWETGTYGHVAIFIEGDVNSFRSFDQNYPTGSPCHIQNHNYDKCLGWLRFKGQTQNQQALIDALRKERDDNWNLYQETLNLLNGAKAESDSLRDQLKRCSENHASQLRQFATILGTSDDTAELAGEMMKLVGVEDNLRKANEKIDTLTKEAVEDQEKIDEQEKMITDATELDKSRLAELQLLTEAKKKVENDLLTCQKEVNSYKPDQQVGNFITRFFNWLRR